MRSFKDLKWLSLTGWFWELVASRSVIVSSDQSISVFFHLISFHLQLQDISSKYRDGNIWCFSVSFSTCCARVSRPTHSHTPLWLFRCAFHIMCILPHDSPVSCPRALSQNGSHCVPLPPLLFLWKEACVTFTNWVGFCSLEPAGLQSFSI